MSGDNNANSVMSISNGNSRSSSLKVKKIGNDVGSVPVPSKKQLELPDHENQKRTIQVSPKRKGRRNQHHHHHHHHDKNNPIAKAKKSYPCIERFRSEEKQSQELSRVLRRRGLYDSPEGLHRRHEVVEGLEDLLNQWNVSLLTNNPADVHTLPPRVALLSFGSYRLQVHKPDADMDLLALCPLHCTRSLFFTTLVDILKKDDRIADVHPIPAAYTPVIKFKMHGISIDLLFAGLRNDTKLLNHQKGSTYNIDDSDLQGLDVEGVRSLNGARVAQILSQSVPNLDAYRTTLRIIKEWANVHGLYSNVLGCLGGINYALLVACICRRHKSAQPPTLLKAFFHTFSNWQWPTPVTLTHIVHQPPPGVLPLPVWDAKTNPRDRIHVMPILTPTYPTMNSAYNVGIPQLRRLTSALKSGLQIVLDIEAGNKEWTDLFRNDFFERHAIFLQTTIIAANGAEFLEWFRFVESRMRLLIAGLDNPHYGVQAEPFCKFFDRMYDSKGICQGMGKSDPQNKTESCLFIGLRFDTDNVDLSGLVAEFLHKVNTWKGRVAGMDLSMEIVRRESIPKFVYDSSAVSTHLAFNECLQLSQALEQIHGVRPEPSEISQHEASNAASSQGSKTDDIVSPQSETLQEEAIHGRQAEETKAIKESLEEVHVNLDESVDDHLARPPETVSWAMKVIGNNRIQDGQLKAIVSPAKRART